MASSRYFSHAFHLLLIWFLLALFLIPPGLTETPVEKGEVLVACYIVGSDLESDHHLATREISEMVSGMPASPVVDLVLAYGGSDKPGWEGMTIAGYHDLAVDIRDGMIGNNDLFRFRYPDANMGSSQSLISFLRYLEGLGSYSTKILIFWDHGADYDGICFDERHGDDHLDLEEIRQSLHDGKIIWDLIGMDACLMGSYEVASAVSLYGRYLLVSEEIVPGHGLDYTHLLTLLNKNPAMSVESLGMAVIDRYIDNPDHEPTKKTLSLIDLTRFDEIDLAAGELGISLSTQLGEGIAYRAIGNALQVSQRFGYDLKTDQEISVDLFDFASRLSGTVPGSEDPISRLMNAVLEAIVYQRNDGSRPGAHGISIFSPRNRNAEEVHGVSALRLVNPGWQRFLSDYVAYHRHDTGSPQIVPLGGGRYRITDDEGIASVFIDTVWRINVTDPFYYGLSQEPIYPDEDGTYQPDPEDAVFTLEDTGSGEKAMMYTLYLGNESGTENFCGIVQVMRGQKTKDALAHIRVQANGTITYSLTPYEQKSDDRPIFSKAQITPRSGDLITPLFKKVDLNDSLQHAGFIPLTSVRLTGDMRITRERLPYGSLYPIMEAIDYSGNYALADLGYIRPHNEVVILP